MRSNTAKQGLISQLSRFCSFRTHLRNRNRRTRNCRPRQLRSATFNLDHEQKIAAFRRQRLFGILARRGGQALSAGRVCILGGEGTALRRHGSATPRSSFAGALGFVFIASAKKPTNPTAASLPSSQADHHQTTV